MYVRAHDTQLTRTCKEHENSRIIHRHFSAAPANGGDMGRRVFLKQTSPARAGGLGRRPTDLSARSNTCRLWCGQCSHECAETTALANANGYSRRLSSTPQSLFVSFMDKWSLFGSSQTHSFRLQRGTLLLVGLINGQLFNSNCNCSVNRYYKRKSNRRNLNFNNSNWYCGSNSYSYNSSNKRNSSHRCL